MVEGRLRKVLSLDLIVRETLEKVRKLIYYGNLETFRVLIPTQRSFEFIQDEVKSAAVEDWSAPINDYDKLIYVQQPKEIVFFRVSIPSGRVVLWPPRMREPERSQMQIPLRRSPLHFSSILLGNFHAYKILIIELDLEHDWSILVRKQPCRHALVQRRATCFWILQFSPFLMSAELMITSKRC